MVIVMIGGRYTANSEGSVHGFTHLQVREEEAREDRW